MLAKAKRTELEDAVGTLPAIPSYRFLRQPEAGLVMVRGRIGGTGGPFNLGEMTVTRCAVQLDGGGAPGIGYVAGRDSRHAELAALLDALLQRRNGLDLDLVIDRLKPHRPRGASAPRPKSQPRRSISSPWFGSDAMKAMDLSIPAAFADPVGDAQAAFRLILGCMAEPGTIRTLSRTPASVPGLGPAAAATALSLADFETPVWLGPKSKPAAPWLRFHCGTPIVDEPGRARFAFADAGQSLPDLESFDLGTDEFPDRSATLIIELPDLQVGKGLRLSGPGIAEVRRLEPAGLTPAFWAQRTALAPLFPRGLDLILTSGARMAALPRTTRVES